MLVFAHRGASAVRPENTVEAFVEAGRLGADGVELDVRRTADGQLAVRHDPTLDDGRSIVDLAAEELPPSVPLLAAALDACGGMVVNVEIKNLPHEPDFDPEAATVVLAVVGELRRRGRPERFLVSSFHPVTVDRVRREAPELPTALLVHRAFAPAMAVELAAAAGHVALHPHHSLVDAGLVEECHDAGLRVNVWTVDDPARIRALADLGVDGVVTNVPDVAVAALGRHPD
jgi:glycerophosphoryl diester phosphodiesterase